MIKNFLKEEALKAEINLSEEQLQKFDIYANFLIEKNKKTNLTAIIKPESVVVKHFIDSMTMLKKINLKQKASVVDIGTGAGFPGVPIKIARPDIEITLIDSSMKKATFIEELLFLLEIKATIKCLRAEEGGRLEVLREKFDIATARAVASLGVLAEYCLPYVKKGGLFVALKGPQAIEEANNSVEIINDLGGEVEEVKSFSLSNAEKRAIVVIKKTRNTPEKYPRRNSAIKNKKSST